MTREYDHIVVRMTDGTVYTGKVHLLGHSRIHDLLNSEQEPYLALKGVMRGQSEMVRWVLLNKNNILSVEPPAGEESGEYHTPGFTERLPKA